MKSLTRGGVLLVHSIFFPFFFVLPFSALLFLSPGSPFHLIVLFHRSVLAFLLWSIGICSGCSSFLLLFFHVFFSCRCRTDPSAVPMHIGPGGILRRVQVWLLPTMLAIGSAAVRARKADLRSKEEGVSLNRPGRLNFFARPIRRFWNDQQDHQVFKFKQRPHKMQKERFFFLFSSAPLECFHGGT